MYHPIAPLSSSLLKRRYISLQNEWMKWILTKYCKRYLLLAMSWCLLKDFTYFGTDGTIGPTMTSVSSEHEAKRRIAIPRSCIFYLDWNIWCPAGIETELKLQPGLVYSFETPSTRRFVIGSSSLWLCCASVLASRSCTVYTWATSRSKVNSDDNGSCYMYLPKMESVLLRICFQLSITGDTLVRTCRPHINCSTVLPTKDRGLTIKHNSLQAHDTKEKNDDRLTC